MPTFPQWEATVAEHCYDKVDYISVHQYFDNHQNDLATFLGSSLNMDRFIDTVVATCDFAQAKKRPRWTVGPAQLEDVYAFEDALVVGCLINTLLRHADRVKIACLAQLVNVIAPNMTLNGGDAWRQTIFWSLYHASKYGRGTSLDVRVEVACYDNATYGDVLWLDVSAVRSEEGNRVTDFAVNRSPDQTIELGGSFAGLEHLKLVGHTVLHHDDIRAINDEARPNNVAPVERSFGRAPAPGLAVTGRGVPMATSTDLVTWELASLLLRLDLLLEAGG